MNRRISLFDESGLRLKFPRSRENGSILFLILLVVILFAALTYAVGGWMRSGNKNGSTEANRAAASAILQWFTAVDNAVVRMHVNGVAYEDMSFLYSSGKYYNGAALGAYMDNSRCTSDTCRIFKTDGGGVAPPDFSKYGNPNVTGVNPASLGAGYMVMYMMQWPGADTSANDVVLRLWIMSGDVCRALNTAVNVTTPPSLAGTANQGSTVANWDNPGYTFTASYEQFYGQDTFAGSIASSGTADEYCHINHLVIRR